LDRLSTIKLFFAPILGGGRGPHLTQVAWAEA